MHERARELIDLLELQPHPEGGHYRELFRSPRQVQSDGRGRAALTSIYFLLAHGEHSRWHVVRGADEVWNHHEGDPLELFWLTPEGNLRREVLGPASQGITPQVAVPAGCWQAARPIGSFALVGCSVAPGFEFTDFALARDIPGVADVLRAHAPQLAALV